jgi:hypothetical protein
MLTSVLTNPWILQLGSSHAVAERASQGAEAVERDTDEEVTDVFETICQAPALL